MEALWVTVGAVGAVVLLAALGRLLWTLRPRPGRGGLPTTPVQRLAWTGMGISGVVGIGLAVLVLIGGAVGFEENATFRGIFAVLVLVGVGTWLAAWYATGRRGGGAVIDERDRAILARSLRAESTIVLLALVAWTVVLTEVFWDAGAVPIAYLQLLFWSTFIAGVFGRCVGILLGYRTDSVTDA